MSGLVEVGASKIFGGIGDGVFRQQHRAKHALLGFDILRGHATDIGLVVFAEGVVELIGTVDLRLTHAPSARKI